MRRFLKYELDRYLRAAARWSRSCRWRGWRTRATSTTRRARWRWWLEVVGAEKVNRALAALLREFAFKPAPYPNSTDFLRILRARLARRTRR